MENGHYRKYIDKKLSEEKLNAIRTADNIIRGYESKGYSLTLRQLYYQFVTRNLFANTEKNYSWLGDVISDGRMMGLVSWTAIEDRNRNLQGLNTYDSPSDVIKAAKNSFRIDVWKDQMFRPEVWIEKDALTGVISPICNELRVDFFACKGYNSQSAQWRAGQRFARYIQKGQRPIVFHLGDHDPSGLDMTRDNQERLSLFAGVQIQVVRLALNMNQIDTYNPPPNPAKLSDSRSTKYISEYGDSSWELDALDPNVIRDIIESAVVRIRDEDVYNNALMLEMRYKDMLDDAIEMMGGTLDEDTGGHDD